LNRDEDAIDKAIGLLWLRRGYVLADRTLIVALLLRAADWRPLRARWWRKKQVSIIGADLDGNFFLRHSDGSVRYWDHRLQADLIVAPSVREFCQRLVEVAD
jgi:hypothetical protein